VDKKKSADQIAAFFAACPSSADPDAQSQLSTGGDVVLQARVAAAMRARLASETDPERLKEYTTLWGLEFRAHPPTEHDALRKQVAEDLKRLETLNPHPDAAWLVFLKNGYKQSGASAETVTAKEERVIQTFRHSNEAYQIVSDRWDKVHKEPEDQRDSAAWDKYHAEHRQALKQWKAQFTDSRELQHQEMFWEFRFDPNVAEEEGMRVFGDYLEDIRAYERPSIGGYLALAGFLTYHKWHPERVFDLLRDWNKLADEWETRILGDNMSKDAEDVFRSNDVILRQRVAGEILTAARMVNRPAEAVSVKAYVERELRPKSWPNIEIWYWWNRARLSALEGSKADALTYYQKALRSRKKPWELVEGHAIDDLADEARALWKELGGSEMAWNLWSKPPAAAVEEAAAADWKKPEKDMPFFELADLSGKTWRLRDLGGRVLFINVWATWCGPCQEELPQVEKLYEKVKDRKDVQVLTLTIDDDLGAVAPFMKEKGYTFPVLPAKSFVFELLDLVGIPQNWIVDTKGVWRWTGRPGGPMTEWGDKVLHQMEAVR
jgi:thiol-disulfide isomerase/thioredoxin